MKIKKNQKGFTLIELLIVVAIIAILAAIAIPQFAAYRIRGFNSSAASDARNWKTTQEAGNSSFFSYLNSNGGVVIPGGPPAIGPGIFAIGPQTAATTSQPGSFLQTPFYASRNPLNIVMGALGIGVGNNVTIRADNAVSPTDVNIADRAIIQAKHLEGDTVYGIDLDSTAVYWCKHADWGKQALQGGITPAVSVPTPGLTAVDDFAGSVACGGSPITTWVAL